MSELQQVAEIVLKVSVVVFMAGNLLAIGLETDAKAALAPLGDVRFVLTAALLDCLFCPGLAWLIARLLPIDVPYANGLLLIGLAPAAPFLPTMVRRAGGDLAYTAAFMVIAAVATVVLMPLAVPLIVPGLSVDPWNIAKPIVALIFLPVVIGMTAKTVAPSLAAGLLKVVRPVGSAATLLLLLAIGVRYFDGFVGAVGSYAIAAQLLYAVGLLLGAHVIGAGLPPGQRNVLSLGACTRNLGAALAPLLVAPADPRAMVMVALAVPITLGVTYLAAGWLAQRAGREPS